MSEPRLYILMMTSRPNRWAYGRFRESARKLGLTIRSADPSQAMLEISRDSLSVRVGGRRLGLPKSVLPRLGPGNYENGLAMLSHFEAAGIPVCNTSHAIALARDTHRTLLEFRKIGLHVPRTARLLSIKDLKLARKEIPGPPWILKTYTGAMGIGTMLVTEVDQLEAVAATLWALGQPILMQEFVRSSKNTISDIRALVVGKQILGAIRRSAQTGEFRANVHRGGVPEPVELSSREKKLALKAARAVGLDIAGIDWIETADGPVFMEANATPGFQGFEAATGIDVAAAILQYADILARRS